MAEKPLSLVGEESYLYYRKGAVVMAGLRDLLGERLNDALSSFYDAHHGPGRSPGARDLVESLLEVASEEERSLIHDWLDGVVLYDLELKSATVAPVEGGRFVVTLEITAGRRGVTGTSMKLDERLAIALFDSDPDLGAGVLPLHFTHHRLVNGDNRITITTDGPPAFAAVDPYVTRVDVNPFDNVREVGRP